jgi:hypothetical protein
MSSVPDSAGTSPALDICGDTANFADRMMNENGNVLNSIKENVQLMWGLRHSFVPKK